MSGSPPATKGPSPAGCGLALVIGVAVVVGDAVAFSLLTERTLNLDAETGVLFCQMLIVATPFIALAVAGARKFLPWLTALAFTLALWGYGLADGVAYQRHPDGTGANIGFGLMILVSPLFIGAAALGLHFWGLRRRH